jgi:RNA polymerase sigma factor (sigma-70 family)
MKTADKSVTEARIRNRRHQSQALRQKEASLAKLASERNRKEFLKQLASLLPTVSSFIKRRLRAAYLTLDVRTLVDTTGDILDRVLLKAYENYDTRPPDLTLEQWLYQLANQTLEQYIRKWKSIETKRRSLEALNQAELRSLEEIPFTADAEGERYLVEDLDDSEYHLDDFLPARPVEHYQPDPERELERKEELQQILEALSRVPQHERIVFELFAMEDLSKDDVGKILNIPADEVPRIAEKVRAQVRRALESSSTKAVKEEKTS